MSSFTDKARLIIQDRTLRKRIIFLLAALFLFRVLAIIPIPGVNAAELSRFFSGNEFLGLLNIFSGGGLSNLSIIMLGVGPYITASIIMQLLTIMSPRLKALYQEEGDAGRKKFAQYSRLLTVPMAVIQGFAFLTLLNRQGVLPSLSGFDMLMNVIIITAGSMLLTWIGELITEFGVGNGVSIIIFAGIVSALPGAITQLVFTFDPSQIPLYLAFLVAALAIVFGVVIITEAERPIPITYAKRVRGMKVYGGISTYLPIRVNQAGVIPIIFALSILLFPQMFFSFLANVSNATVQTIGSTMLSILANPWFYSIAYFVLVFAFTYFYTAITFDPESISTNLQKSGAFIPGVRPGTPTAEYIGRILSRLTLVGAIFLGAIAVLPLVMRGITGIQALSIGGTALLIVVSVVIDLIKKIDAQISIREY
ncbi:MAG: preprotein translocase subunit SecY [Candidatus Zambryskibacteria bacterium RIFCSPHIGHO2_01_FULL_43_25]|uniref:Protein translocase subunit SecY n=1 Tax=Candidatus Zambryskibacteria bacterium RIFCSPLOWO2_01_FULL_45_21 TaxID=1802761 RepID=A0A1G2U6A3_9BACT|nr:MAG: preprotein translocase subunit SecY [Candidatus Zambryskibacteria bacterium RIFCSPHIGHO2_01_FULL_43_25]OHB00842.1 MAG: preprotein translocase subunit SecY [Candidatus Zambryskibacteria bacterium RIFCSPHIGHO2_12_FULL_44_12b]OHB04432.1 MAG: preprotein translocase subunit SecY [Candidatus Zambryskibacteria bacterium RIFCSPLOWO2_01_FULL_45_21]